MPIFYTSYRDDKITTAINGLVGKPFGFFENLRMGGTGCQRMIVKSASEGLQQYINDPLYPTYSGLELRPGGILVSLSHVMKRYTWAIPYSRLQIEVGTSTQNAISVPTFKHIEGIIVSLSDGEHTLVLEDARAGNRKFFSKLLAQYTAANGEG
jgi:hypothetical protein